jgi:hypothetical protein
MFVDGVVRAINKHVYICVYIYIYIHMYTNTNIHMNVHARALRTGTHNSIQYLKRL